MSRVIFKVISPAFIAAAGILFVVIWPRFQQHLVIAFSIIYYAMVRFSRWRFGPPVGPVAYPPPATLTIERKAAKALREMALHEYEYIRETMAQAMNDRHTLVNYFLLTTGLMIAAIGAVYSQEGMSYSPYTHQITIAICLILSFVAWIYLLKIIRLRQAWCESSVAMNRIKQFFLVNAGLTDEHAASPFLWKSKTIPRPAKKGNLYHLEFILISVIAALAIALVSVMLLLANDQQKSFWIPVVFFVHHFLLQLSAYDVFLEDKPKKPGRSAGRPSATKENSAPGSEEAAPSHPAASPTSLPPPSPRQVIIHHQETLYRNFFEVQKATLQYEKFDGTLTDHVQRFNCARRHSAAILLHDPVKDDLVLVEQFRYPAYVYDAKKSWLIEIIAGIIENNESPAEVARREAMEETGYEVHGLKFLCEFFPSPGGSSERVFIFFGMVGRQVAEGGGLSDEAENIRVVRLPAREAYRLADEGAIHDAKTLVALLSVRERLSKSISRHGA